MTNWTSATNTPAEATSNLINADTRREPQAVVGRGGIEITGTGPVKSSAPATYHAGQEAPVDNSIMATVKSASGGPIINRSPNGNDIVSTRGMTTTINAAVAAGLLVRNQDGSFADKQAPVTVKDPTGQAQPKAAGGKAPEDKAQADTFGLPESAQNALGQIVTTVQPGDAIKAMDSVLIRGEVDARTIERMATQAGVEPGEMLNHIATAQQGFYDVATGIIEGAGIDTDAFEAFVKADPRRNSQMIETARAMVMSNDTKGLEALTSNFYEHADKFMPAETREALTEAGYRWQDTPDGLKVLINGTPVSFGVAVKQRIVTFSRG